MSARAAWRLESLGFTQVFRYAPGKEDWFASGLPGEGKQADIPHIGDLARRDVPTCRLTDRAGEVGQRMKAAGGEVCVVVNDQNVVLGLVKSETPVADPQATVEQVMQSGPTTIRPRWPLDEAVSYMQGQELDHILVTTSDGQLIGLLYRGDVERRLDKSQAVTGRES